MSRPRKSKLQIAKPNASIFSALKRADSSASTKRKVSSISASDASDHENADSPLLEPEAGGFFGEEANKPAENQPESPLFDIPDESDQLESNMPWLKTMTKLVNSFNFYCTHQGFCHPNCFKRQMRAAKRIMESTRKVRVA